MLHHLHNTRFAPLVLLALGGLRTRAFAARADGGDSNQNGNNGEIYNSLRGTQHGEDATLVPSVSNSVVIVVAAAVVLLAFAAVVFMCAEQGDADSFESSATTTSSSSSSSSSSSTTKNKNKNVAANSAAKRKSKKPVAKHQQKPVRQPNKTPVVRKMPNKKQAFKRCASLRRTRLDLCCMAVCEYM